MAEFKLVFPPGTRAGGFAGTPGKGTAGGNSAGARGESPPTPPPGPPGWTLVYGGGSHKFAGTVTSSPSASRKVDGWVYVESPEAIGTLGLSGVLSDDGYLDLRSLTAMEDLQVESMSPRGFNTEGLTHPLYIVFSDCDLGLFDFNQFPYLVDFRAPITSATPPLNTSVAITSATLVNFSVKDWNLTSFNPDGCPNCVDISLWNNNLNQAAMTTLLQKLVAIGKTGGTVTLIGMGPLDAGGLTAKGTLESRGWTLFVDS